MTSLHDDKTIELLSSLLLFCIVVNSADQVTYRYGHNETAGYSDDVIQGDFGDVIVTPENQFAKVGGRAELKWLVALPSRTQMCIVM